MYVHTRISIVLSVDRHLLRERTDPSSPMGGVLCQHESKYTVMALYTYINGLALQWLCAPTLCTCSFGPELDIAFGTIHVHYTIL